MREFRASQSDDELTEAVAAELMERIRHVVPVLSAPLVASVLLEREGPSQAEVIASVSEKLSALRSKSMPRPRRDAEELVVDILKRFERRDLISRTGDALAPTQEGRAVLEYYARTIAHHFPEEGEISAFAK